MGSNAMPKDGQELRVDGSLVLTWVEGDSSVGLGESYVLTAFEVGREFIELEESAGKLGFDEQGAKLLERIRDDKSSSAHDDDTP